MKHRHHKIPRHAGGTDNPENIELLSIEEHANAHRILFEKYGRWQDRVAWLGLSKRIGKQEAERIAHLEGIAQFRSSAKAKDVDTKRGQSLKKKYATEKHWKTGLKKETDFRVEKAATGVKAYYDAGGAAWNTGKTKATDARIVKISENTKRQAREGNFHCIGDYQRGRTFDEDHRKKLSEKAMKRTPKTCEHCGVTVSPAMHTRWHGDNCKRRS